MACWLTVPSHQLHQYGILLTVVLWHSSESNFTAVAQATINGFKKNIPDITVTFFRGQWINTGEDTAQLKWTISTHINVFFSEIVQFNWKVMQRNFSRFTPLTFKSVCGKIPNSFIGGLQSTLGIGLLIYIEWVFGIDKYSHAYLSVDIVTHPRPHLNGLAKHTSFMRMYLSLS